jgi:hypothetical protein
MPDAPIRDDAQLGPHEDLDREIDGVPHSIVGMTALFSIMLALLVGVVFVSGGAVSKFAAIALLVLAIPVLVTTLHRRADRQRDHAHPAR